MESQDREPTGDSPEIELEPLSLRQLQQFRFAVGFGGMSVFMLVHLILLPHILTAGAMLCFAAAAVVSVRTMGRSPKLTGKPRPREHMRPLFAHFRRLVLILVLFVGGILLFVLRGYLHG
jgi:hypothetical protein